MIPNTTCLKQSFRAFFKIFVFLATALPFYTPGYAHGQVTTNLGPVLEIQSPSNGIGLYDTPTYTSPFYNKANMSVFVVGKIIGVPRFWFNGGNFQIKVNGHIVPATVNLSSRNIVVGGVRITSGTFAAEVPVSDYQLWPMRPFVAELVHVPSGRVYARDRIVIYDLRWAAQATPFGDLRDKVTGMRTQLTDYGLGYLGVPDFTAGLETPHISSLPQPSLSEFNQDLTDRARKIPRHDDDTNLLNACQRLDEVSESRFRDPLQFGPYASALLQAQGAYQAYVQGRNFCGTLVANLPAMILCYLAVESSCVKSPPQANDFELCVDQIEGTPETLTIAAVDDVSLNFLSSTNGKDALIQSHVALSGFHGTVDGHLRSLSVRWRYSPCAARPSASLDDLEIPNNPWIESWATCPAMDIHSDLATTVTKDKPAKFSVFKAGRTLEQLKSKLVNAGTFSFEDNERDAEKGTCAEDFIKEHADEMLVTFREPMRNKLKKAWFGNASRSQHADALTALFSTWNLGTVEHPDLSLSAQFNQIYSAPLMGMTTDWTTYIEPLDQLAAKNRRLFYFYFPESLPIVSIDGLDVLGRQFDLSFGLTTAFLNRLLNVKAADDSLRFIFTPTWAELSTFGVVAPAGVNLEDPVTLDENILYQFDPAFRAIGTGDVEIVVSPTFDPIVYMPPDPAPQYIIPQVGSPTTYGIEDMQMVFKFKDTIAGDGSVIPGPEFLRASVNFTDTEFRLIVDERAGAQFLLPQVIDDTWHAHVLKSNLKDCPMFVVANPPVGNCEDLLEVKLAELMSIRLRDTFIEYLSRISAPLFFNADGRASIPVQLDGRTRHQAGQHITYYGRLRE